MSKATSPITTIEGVNVVTDEVIIGYDPEFADLGNPEGAIWRKKDFVEAVTKDGRRFRHQTQFDLGSGKAQALAAKVGAAGAIDLAYWAETFSVYGSDAWQAEDNLRRLEHQAGPLAGTVRDI